MLYTTSGMSAELDGRGVFTALTVCGQQILQSPAPFVSLCRDGRILTPVRAEAHEDGTLLLTMEDGGIVTVSVRSSALCLCIEAVRVPGDAEALVFGPVCVTPDEVVGDVIGVVQGGEIAVGMMAGNRKTIEGVPLSQLDRFDARCGWLHDPGPEAGRVQALYMRAASWLAAGGASLQFWAKDRSREEIGYAAGAQNMLIEPLPEGDPDARIEGAKILLFGCPRKDALERIGQIEEAEGLPHPRMEDGEWVKTARRAMKS